MNSSKVIIISVIFILTSILSIYILKANKIISNLIAYTSIWALFITSINYGLGMISIKIGINRNYKVFMISFFGGMLIRLILLILLVFIGLQFLEIRRNIFIFLVLFFYILYLISEISYLLLLDKEHNKIND
ncbi:MAG: hypothetical protein CO128_06120 [Ignavibacteriales bacterium CG_4_9_14_3_um_filter_30_11]|nr:MAG: hypothetical protein CO128_06120 [Ignavibacteriales bacterium CG_4_9_14_3_um_filter_30_11]